MLDERHRETLRAAVDRIVPPDSRTPGGAEAGALGYLLSQLDGDLAGEASNYEMLLSHLEREAVAAYGDSFVALPPEIQTSLLQQAEASETHGRFFYRFVEHVQEGFYTSPVAWDMIGWKVSG